MTKYFVMVKQKGEGCDYTVGCGYTHIEISAHSEEEIMRHVEEKFYGIDIDYIYYAKVSDMKRLTHEDAIEVAERREYERLKKKYNSK